MTNEEEAGNGEAVKDCPALTLKINGLGKKGVKEVTVHCPFYATILEHNNDLKWIKRLLSFNTIALITTLIGITAAVITLLQSAGGI